MSSQEEIASHRDTTEEEIQYKVIDGKKHLTFASIRRYNHGTLSRKDNELAAAHIGRCQRCRNILKDLTGPTKTVNKTGRYKVIAVLSVVLIATALAVYFVTYDFGKPNILSKQLSKAEAIADEAAKNDQMALAETQVLENPVIEEAGEISEAISEPDGLSDEPVLELDEEPAEQTVAFNPAPNNEPVVEAPVEEIVTSPTPAVRTRKVYGKITMAGSGETVSGVNVMVDGSNQAKISNAIGGYNIQIPRSATELIFIYRGKKLYKKINPNTSLVNVQLDLDKMVY